MNIERALVIGAGGAIGRATVTALRAAGADVVAGGRDRDATDPDQVAALLEEADPDVVVIAAGARPRMTPIDQHSWASFSAAWDVDVRITYEVGRAALARPLRPGAKVVVVSSGAALGGSPLSGGYAGAKRTQMFMVDYLQRTADVRGLGLCFAALLPQQLVATTAIGEAAAAAYGAELGESIEAYMSRRFPVPLEPDGVAAAVVAIATGEQDARLVGVTAAGHHPIPGC